MCCVGFFLTVFAKNFCDTCDFCQNELILIFIVDNREKTDIYFYIELVHKEKRCARILEPSMNLISSSMKLFVDLWNPFMSQNPCMTKGHAYIYLCDILYVPWYMICHIAVKI